MARSPERLLLAFALAAWLLPVHGLAALALLSSYRVQESCARLSWDWCAGRSAEDAYALSRRAFLLAGLPERGERFVLLLGDSRLDGQALAPEGAGVFNAAIGGQSVAQLLEWVEPVFARRRWCAVVIQSGYNDLKTGTAEAVLDDFRRLGELIGRDTPWLLTQPLSFARDRDAAPARGREVEAFRRLGAGLEALAGESPAWRYVPAPERLVDPAGYLAVGTTRADGVHLTQAAATVYRRALREALAAALPCD